MLKFNRFNSGNTTDPMHPQYRLLMDGFRYSVGDPGHPDHAHYRRVPVGHPTASGVFASNGTMDIYEACDCLPASGNATLFPSATSAALASANNSFTAGIQNANPPPGEPPKATDWSEVDANAIGQLIAGWDQMEAYWQGLKG